MSIDDSVILIYILNMFFLDVHCPVHACLRLGSPKSWPCSHWLGQAKRCVGLEGKNGRVVTPYFMGKKHGKKHGKHGKENGLLKLLNQSIETAAIQVVASLEADIQYISVWNHPCEHKENHLPQVVAFSYFGRFQSLNFGGSKERECAAWFGWSQILTFLW